MRQTVSQDMLTTLRIMIAVRQNHVALALASL